MTGGTVWKNGAGRPPEQPDESTLRNAARYLGWKPRRDARAEWESTPAREKNPRAANRADAPQEPLRPLLLSAWAELRAVAQPRYRGQVFSVSVTGGNVALGGLPPVASRNLAQLMENAGECAALGCTLGRETDGLIARRMLAAPAVGAAIGALASAYADECAASALAELEKPYAAKGLRCSPRFSPGYGDLPLTFQKPLCAALELWRIGIALTEACMMLPEKSVTALAALRRPGRCPESDRGEHACDRCGLTACPYREEASEEECPK